MRGAIRISFLNEKDERLAEIHKQTVAVYCDVMNRQNVSKWSREFSEEKADVHDGQRSGRPSVISDELLQKNELILNPNTL
jgi:hypothetical protein